ncbi:MAG: FAD binding domain-containing protein [Anaerolineae bacterium]|nr:FAD binding domain-containing protein [Anaerolineae bacterium]
MLRLPPFEYHAPRSIEQAVNLGAEHGTAAMFVAGGTDLYPNMKRRQFTPQVLIGLNGVEELRGISNGDGITIRAGTTLHQVSNSPLLQTQYPALATAAKLVSTPQLRAMGTLGGNLCLDTRCNYYNQEFSWRQALGFCMKKDGEICMVAPGSSRCWAVSSTDCAPVVVALEGRVRLVSARGERVIAASDLYRDDGIEYLGKARDEIVTEILLPPADGTKSVYLKLRRRDSFDFPILGVAAALRLASNGEIESARIVLGGVGSRPLECVDSARLLIGQKLSHKVIGAAAEAAWRPARPLDNTDSTHSYRKKMARVYVARALGALSEQ